MRVFLLFLFACTLIFGESKVDIKVAKMHCPLCTMAVKKAIKSVDGVQKVSVKLNTKTANVVFDEKATNIDAILEAIKTTSYEGKILK